MGQIRREVKRGPLSTRDSAFYIKTSVNVVKSGTVVPVPREADSSSGDKHGKGTTPAKTV